MNLYSLQDLRLLLNKSLEPLEAESGQILLYDDQTKLLKEITTTADFYPGSKAVEGVFAYVLSSEASICIEELKSWEPSANMNSRLAIRLVVDDRVIGILNAESPRLSAFNQKHQQIIEGLAPLVALALQTAQWLERSIHHIALLEAASEVSSYAISIRNPDELLTKTVQTIVKEFELYYAAIYLVDEQNREWAILRTDSSATGRELVEKGHRLRVGSNTAVGQALGPFGTPRRFSYGPQDQEPYNTLDLLETRSEIALPLISRTTDQNRETLGALSVHSTQENAFLGEDVKILHVIADQLAIALGNARSFQRSVVERRLNNILREIDRRIINPYQSKTDVLTFILDKSCQLTDAEAGQFFLVEGEDTLFVAAATETTDLGQKIPMIIGTIIGDAIFQNAVLISDLDDLRQLPKDAIIYNLSFKPEKRSWAVVCVREEEGQPIGVLSVEHSEPNQFTEEHIDILFALAGQAAIAIKNRTLTEQAEVRTRHLEATAQVGADIISVLDVTELLNKTADLIYQKFHLYYFGIYLIDYSGKNGSGPPVARLKAAAGADGPQLLSRSHQFAIDRQSTIGLTIQTGKAQTIQVTNLRVAERPEPETLSKIFLPLRDKDQIIGAVEAQSIDSVFARADLQILQTLADQLAVAISNARLYEHNSALFDQARRQAALLKTAAQVSQSVISIFERDELLNTIVNTICDQFEDREFHYVTVFLIDDTDNYALQQAGAGKLGPEMRKEKLKLEPDTSIVGAVICSGQGQIELNLQAKDELYREHLLLPNAQSEMALPLRLGAIIIGALTIHSYKKDAFTKEDIQTLQPMANQLAIAIDNAQKQKQLLEAEMLKTIGETASQSMHWVANQTLPIKIWIEQIEKKVGPIIREIAVDEDILEDFLEGVKIVKENAQLILEAKTGIMGPVREFELSAVNLATIIEAALKQIKLSPDQIELNIPSALPLVLADRVAIEEVFRNLFVNAVRAMKNTPKPKLQIQAQLIGDSIEVQVIDNGEGIPQDKISHIWKPFYTMKAESGGTGVGLSYCRQAMVKMKGTIQVQSELGQGTTFSLHFLFISTNDTIG